MENQLYTSTVSFLNSKNILCSRTMILTNSCLYYCKKGTLVPTQMSVIKWKPFNPFIENLCEVKRFGFTIGNETTFQDFFVDNSTLLDTWIEKLSQVVIMSEIENDYVKIKPLGQGSFAEVHLACDRTTKEPFAIKVYNKQAILESKGKLASLMTEIEILRMLNNPMCNRVHRIYENSSSISLVLDYSEGGTLLERIEKIGKFSESESARFIFNLLRALEYLHSLQITHRDLKPENILMTSKTENTELKLCDFGLSCIAVSEITQFCGSAGYIAPEILQNMPHTSKVDIYSAGIILYVILSGTHPFIDDSAQGVMAKNRLGNIRFSRESWKCVSPKAIKIIKQMTAHNPKYRIGIEEALQHPWILENLNISSSESKTAGSTPAKGEKKDFSDYLYRRAIFESSGD